MAKITSKKPAEYIEPLVMNRLQGRMLRMPAPGRRTREILLVYGHHSSIERWWGLALDLNRYGAVTMPDLPGFGGMQSFYKIGQQPTVDNLADYLAAFIKLRYRRRRLTIVGMSFGFVVVTRMLQRYPDLARKVDLLISVVGFAHHDDFTFRKPRYYFYLGGATLFSRPLPSIFFRNVFLQPLVLNKLYKRSYNARQKFHKLRGDALQDALGFEYYLWQLNDVRTYMKTTAELLRLDNCRKQIDLPLWHISVKRDRYFDNVIVEQHLRVIFNDFHEAPSRFPSHAPTAIADAVSAAPLIPRHIRKLLAEQP